MDCQVDTDNSASDMSSFLGSGITVQIKGSDLGTLQELAGKVAGVVAVSYTHLYIITVRR